MKKFLLLAGLLFGLQNYAFSQDSTEDKHPPIHISISDAIMFGPTVSGWQTTPPGVKQHTAADIGADAFFLWQVPLVGKHLKLDFGLGISNINIHTDYQFLLFDKEGKINEADKAPAGYKLNKLSLTYLEIPLELGFRTLRHDGTRKGFRIAVGARGGWCFDSHTKLEESEGVVIKYKSMDGINRWRFGLTGRVGYGQFSLFGRYDLTSSFTGENVPTYAVYSAGIMIGGF